MKNFFFLIIGLAFIGGCIYLFLQKPVPTRFNLIQIGDAIFKVEIADTDEKRIQGLSNRESLPENSGMLFVFENPDKHGIWMKDMKFPIDIAWLDAQKTVFWVEKSVSPDTFPQVFYPPSEALYVLEVPAGTFKKNHIDIGEMVYKKD